ncbi:hypothetical protein CHARACLAT_017908 [Characodon lateralis]|uniref:Uncharacterized protein n=1 Tax=Characodon lateralis TaxID=208331 RepID=A0ABU7EKM0_9TELE|nr:hypothetical protein [Characodon lateralis]
MLFGVCYLPSFLFLSFTLPLRGTFFLCLAPLLFVPLWKQLMFSSATCGQLMAKDISLIHSNDESRWETGRCCRWLQQQLRRLLLIISNYIWPPTSQLNYVQVYVLLFFKLEKLPSHYHSRFW